jgi:RNA polymerase sigma-70 factor (ECF subfamily)
MIGHTAREFRQLSDEELIALCRTNNAKALEALLSRYDKYIFSIAMRLAGNVDDANDLVSETALRVYRHIGDFQHAVTLPAWLKRVVTNAYLDTRRSAMRRPACSLDGMVEEMGDSVLADTEQDEYDPYRAAQASERRQILADAIEALPEAQRAMVSLYHSEERSYEEIAAQMNVPVGTVKSRLNRARAALREALQPQMATLIN